MVAASPALRYLATLGLQLWTVRTELEHDLPGTLAAIKAAGYAQVELMRTTDAAGIAPVARDLGLGLTSAFLDGAAFARGGDECAAELDQSLAAASALDLRYLVLGYLPKGARETEAQLRTHAAAANAFGRRCRDAGIRLCYHHHSFEFAPLADHAATTGWDVLLGEFDPALVQLELDVFWTAIAGRDPVPLLRGLAGRVAQVHLKDLAPDTPPGFDEHAVPADAFRPPGAGSLDFSAILAACAETGVDQCHVEQDQSPDIFRDLRVGIAHLRHL